MQPSTDAPGGEAGRGGAQERMTPEQQARQEIDCLLRAAGLACLWHGRCGLHAARGLATREFPLVEGHEFADHLFWVDGKDAGVSEAKKVSVPLMGV